MPSYNDVIHKARRVRRKLERQWRKSKLPADRIHVAYNKQITVVKDLINDVKKVYYCNKLSHCNAKHMYKTISSLLNTPISLFLSGKKCIIANNCAKYFVDKVIDIRSGILNCMTPFVHAVVPEITSIAHTLSVFSPTDTKEVVQIIKDSPNKS